MKVGLVLTGGSLRGVCGEIGALRLIDELNIKPEIVIGTSAGSIVGSMYCSGMSYSDMTYTMSSLKKKDYLDPDYFGLIKLIFRLGRGWTGFYKGDNLSKWLWDLFDDKRLETCNPRLMITTTNVSRGIPETHTKGFLAELARASSSIPYVFRAKRIEGQYHVDGGAVNNIPVDELVERYPNLDCIIVISVLKLSLREKEVDNEFVEKTFTPFALFDRILDAVKREQKEENLESNGIPVFNLQVDPDKVSLDDIDRASYAIYSGYESALLKKDDLERFLQSVKEKW